MSVGSTERGPRVTRPTIVDVAVRSGVSKSTVSNVIRGVPAVSPRVRERVQAAVERQRAIVEIDSSANGQIK